MSDPGIPESAAAGADAVKRSADEDLRRPAANAARVSRSSAAPIAWLALLLVLALAAGSFYLILELQQREAELVERLDSLEATAGQESNAFEQLRSTLERQIELEIESLEARQLRAREALESGLAARQRSFERSATERAGEGERVDRTLEERLDTLASSLAEQQQSSEQLSARAARQAERLEAQQRQLGELSPADAGSWQLTRVQQQLQLASRSLLLNRDVSAAEALLQTAAGLLRDLDDPALATLQSAVAIDLAALQALPELDRSAIYRRLEAMIDASDALLEDSAPPREFVAEPPGEGDWRARIAEGYRAALARLSAFVVVTRNDVPVEAMMDAQYRSLLRENLRFLLEQAQLAVLAGNQQLFELAVERARGWATAIGRGDAAATLRGELEALAQAQVALELPDLRVSLNALDALMQARLADGAD